MLNFQGCCSEIIDKCLVDKGKLDTYFTFKTSYNYENYFDINNIEKRTMLTKIKLSNHCLRIETRRQEHITNISGKQEILPRCERLCLYRDQGVIENEIHFLLACPLYENLRKDLFININKYHNLYNLNDSAMLSWIMIKPPLYLVCVIISVLVLNCEDYLK